MIYLNRCRCRVDYLKYFVKYCNFQYTGARVFNILCSTKQEGGWWVWTTLKNLRSEKTIAIYGQPLVSLYVCLLFVCCLFVCFFACVFVCLGFFVLFCLPVSSCLFAVHYPACLYIFPFSDLSI